MRTFGSGQTAGQPLLVTAAAAAAAQTLHTAPAGSATPHRVRVLAANRGSAARSLHLLVVDSGGAVVAQFDADVPEHSSAYDVVAPLDSALGELVLNGTTVLKVWADVGSELTVRAVVDDQGMVAGVPSQSIASGLIAAVQNASRYGCGTGVGGVGTGTIGLAEVTVARAGTLRNLRAVASASIGGTATVTVSVFKNGTITALSIPLTVADTTVMATDTDSVAVAAGDRITFGVVTDNAGAPAANIQASVELF